MIGENRGHQDVNDFGCMLHKPQAVLESHAITSKGEYRINDEWYHISTHLMLAKPYAISMTALDRA